MCVDDEPFIIELTKTFLERSGDLQVETFSSALLALDQFPKRGYDAVICDYEMPEMNGIDLLKRLRLMGHDVPFILFTGKGREEVVIEALNNGADFYLQKGGDVKAQFVELEHKVRQAVTKKHAEYALSVVERHEKFLVNIIKQSTQAFIVCYTDGGLGLPNDSFCRMIGHDEDDVKRLNWTSDLTPDEWRETDRRAFLELDLTNRPQRYEKEILRKDGTRVPVEILAHVMKDENGEIRYYYSFINDITERKKATYAVNQAMAAMENSIDGIAILDADGKYVFLNKAHAKIYGYDSPDELIGKSWRILYDEKELDLFEHGHMPSMFKNGSWRGESVGLRRDGSSFPQEVSLTKLEESGLICIVRDTSEMARDKEALRQSQEQLKSVFDNALIGIYRTTPDGNILMANPALIRMLGYDSFEELSQSRDANSLYLEQNREEFVKEIEEKGYSIGMETTWRKADGSTMLIRDSARAIDDNDGRTLYYEGTIEDVTERRKVEEALQKANDKLNLLNSITRHDILNQLILVQGYSDLIKDRDSEKRFVDYMKRIDRALMTIKRQIEFTRDYQKMGVKEPSWQSILGTFNRSLASLEVQGIEVLTEGKDYEVFADSMFEKVFYNLVDNSLRHGVRVNQIKLKMEQSENGLGVTYSDNGLGIPTMDRDRIFQMGFGKNTGLGLFLVKSILGFTQIDITEEGKEGDGVRFVITAPPGSFRPAT
jgi:PAS domain S-box-containing protein